MYCFHKTFDVLNIFLTGFIWLFLRFNYLKWVYQIAFAITFQIVNISV